MKTHPIRDFFPLSALGVLPVLAALLAWKVFVLTAPAPPGAAWSFSCPLPWVDSYHTPSNGYAFEAATDRCWTAPDSAAQVDRWYAARGWEYGGRVGGYWTRFDVDLGPVEVYGWRRAYSNDESPARTSLVMQMYVDLEFLASGKP